MNKQSQCEERDALTSIYTPEELVHVHEPDDWNEEGLRYRFHMRGSNELELIVDVQLPSNYPFNAELPEYKLRLASTDTRYAELLRGQLTSEHRNHIHEACRAAATESQGQVWLYTWVELLRDYFQETIVPPILEQVRVYTEQQESEQLAEALHVADTTAPLPFTIHHSVDAITDRHSVFVAHCAEITQSNHVELFMDAILKDPRVRRATHNILAYRIQLLDRQGMIQDYDDDGETAAGKRLLHLLELTQCVNVVVVVSRWYGGVQLGPDRFKLINNCARDLLVAHGFIKSAK